MLAFARQATVADAGGIMTRSMRVCAGAVLTATLTSMMLAGPARADTVDNLALGLGAGGWVYQQVVADDPHSALSGAEDASFAAPGYDAIGNEFQTGGTEPFGNGPVCGQTQGPNTYWDEFSDMLLRHTVTLPAGAYNVHITGTVDNDAAIYLNGHHVGTNLAGNCNLNTIDMTVAQTDIQAGDNLLAVRAHDYGTGTYFDAAVTYDLDQTAPTLNGLPANQSLEATGPSGTSATWTAPTATDAVDPNPSVPCDHTAGATFPLGTTTVSCYALDAAGNQSSPQSFTITVADTTAPAITGIPTAVSATATSAAGATVTYPNPTASDLVDGTVPVSCLPASGATFALGSTTVTCTATDAHHNTSATHFTVSIAYSWSGVLQPVNPDGSSVFKLGSTVPVKFALTGPSGAITTATATLTFSKISNGVAGSDVEAVSTAAATTGNLFRYDATSGQYIFNWSTKGLTVGTYLLKINLGDGVLHTVQVSLR
ncbi:MAG: hypothetical protein QOF95_3198 [Pseudonocardiales bacterium]|nr:hypothetical protein [Pseudonocardiales bacterium]